MKPTIWIVDDDKSIRWVLERALAQEKLATQSFADADDALNALDDGLPDVIRTVRSAGYSLDTDGRRETVA